MTVMATLKEVATVEMVDATYLNVYRTARSSGARMGGRDRLTGRSSCDSNQKIDANIDTQSCPLNQFVDFRTSRGLFGARA